MKRNFTLLLLSLIVTSAVSAQRLFSDDFNYANGPLTTVSGTVWEHLTGSTKNIQVVDGNLTYAGYTSDPVDTSRMIKLDSSNTANAEKALTRFAKTDTGTIYCSFLLKILSNGNLTAHGSGNGEYFMAFLPASDNTTPIAGVTARRGGNPGTVNLGIFSRIDANTQIVWAPADYNVNDTLLVTIGYQIIPGDTNNVAMLWVNPSLVAPQPVPDAQSADVDAGDSLKLSKLALYQNSARTAICNIDAVKVSSSWGTSVLPLKLLSFNVINNNGYAGLSWQTCNELNVKEFDIERSSDGRNFTRVGSVAATNGSCGTNYSYSDGKQLSGTSYYRLKIVDKDGRVMYSGIVSIDGKLPVKISVFPNPAVDNITITHPKAETGAMIRVVSLSGTVVASVPVAPNAVQTSINISKLTRGNYILVYRNAGEQQTIKIVKQ